MVPETEADINHTDPKEHQMKKLNSLIAGVALAAVAPFALADADPYYLMPEVGGAEITQFVAQDQSPAPSETLSESFWYIGTSGVPSN